MGKSFLLPLICHLLIPDGELSPKVLIGKSRLRSEVNRGENYELLLMIITISIATVMMFDDDDDIYIMMHVCLFVTKNEHFLYRSANNEMKYKYVSINT